MMRPERRPQKRRPERRLQRERRDSLRLDLAQALRMEAEQRLREWERIGCRWGHPQEPEEPEEEALMAGLISPG